MTSPRFVSATPTAVTCGSIACTARCRRPRERVKTAFFDNLMNLLEPDGRCWCLFTPWHHEDLNAALKRNPAFALFRRAVGPNLEPVWPEKWPAEKLAQRRQEIGTLA